MKYIKKFNSYEFVDNEEINEEFISLSKILGFFKGLWNKAMAELAKLGEDPSTTKIKDYFKTNLLNPKDDTYMFKTQSEALKGEVNDQTALDLVNNILNPVDGALGSKNKEALKIELRKKFPADKKSGEKESSQVLTFEYIIDKMRRESIKKHKFAGSTDGNVPDQKKIDIDLKDTTHLDDLKKELRKAKDPNAKKKAVTQYLANLLKEFVATVNNIKDDDVNKFIEDKGGTPAQGGDENSMNYEKLKEFFDKKTPVIYLLKDKKKEDYDPKKKPEEQKDIVGVKVIDVLDDKDGEGSVTFLDKNDAPTIKKSYGDIMGPAQQDQKESDEVLDRVTKDPENKEKVVKFAKFVQDDKNKNKIPEIQKIMASQEEK